MKDAKPQNQENKDTAEQQNEIVFIQEEPVLNGEAPKWLIIQREKTFPLRPASEILNDPIPPEIHTTFMTKKPNLWKCKRCSGMQECKTKPFYCTNCKRDSDFERYTKAINTDRWKLPTWKDIPIEELNMLEIYNDLLDIVKSCIKFQEDIQYELFVLWIIASYKQECFNTVPFLIFRGLIESGKTRALDILREVGYRMVHTTGVSFAAMCRLTHFHNAGILIDEIDNKINKKYEDGQKYLDFLKPSYKRGSTYTVADNEDQEETKTYRNYGFKAFAGETGGYDMAIFSRSIDFPMQQDYPDIPDITYVQDDLSRIQTKLLNYRYKLNDPEPLPYEYPLKGRDREIFSCLIQTAEHVGLESGKILSFVETRKKERIEDIQDTDEYQILKYIQSLEGNEFFADAPEFVTYADIVSNLNWDEDKRRRLGHILRKNLMLKTKRRGDGYILLLNEKKNQERLGMLYRRYHL